ncbi:uncharacterized protein LOC111870128 isoform X2 [Cryptotermes secundus]|uniref:uncharacterized protein LOC111870128 isoform X2 n=1 Tax=Cryptotermes secundus TaxID=105785 RepID=UPI000CD7C805|nr:uncharacterized protein LOC111870128 isoform X2 [Cryptotermes secundus]
MQFCRNTQSLGNCGPQLSGPSGSVWARQAEDALRREWMPKCFLVGIGVVGISYCVVYITGIYERSLTLTVFTLLTFLFIYILWCNHQKQRHCNQNVSATNRTGSSVATISELVSPSSPPCPPAPFNVPDKCDTLPSSRACTPPPSYQEAMLGTAAVNPVLPPPQILNYQEAMPGTAAVNPVLPPPQILVHSHLP